MYRKENSHFLSLLAIGAVLLTIFFLFVGTSHHSTPYIDGGLEQAPVSRRPSLEVCPSQTAGTPPSLVTLSFFFAKRSSGTKCMALLAFVACLQVE